MTQRPNLEPPRRDSTSQPRWSKDQIRQARQTALLPLVQARGIELIEHEADNFEPVDYPGLLIKANYWRWPSERLSGNTIDFFTVVLKTTFHAAMVVITEANPPPKAS